MRFQKGDRVVVRYDRYGQPLPSNTDPSGKNPWEINGSRGTVSYVYNAGMMVVQFDGKSDGVDVFTIRFELMAKDLTCRGARDL
jgi:hypothetical protein